MVGPELLFYGVSIPKIEYALPSKVFSVVQSDQKPEKLSIFLGMKRPFCFVLKLGSDHCFLYRGVS